jgi:hypothetical protein
MLREFNPQAQEHTQIGEASQEFDWIARNQAESGGKRKGHTYVHSCHSMATGENKVDLALALSLLLLLLPPPTFPSHLLLLIHHRLLLTHSTLLCDGRRASDGEDAATTSRLVFPAAGW